MSVEMFIRTMPKVALNLHLEGAVQRETMLILADQNEIRDSVKRFDKWVDLYKAPDFKRIDELTAMLRSWIKHSDDLVRAVYDVGVTLSKENVRYAEININPLSFVSGDFTFDEFMGAINDGRNRAERAWGVQMRWVMVIPREDARRAEEVARWATSATARKGGVVAVSLGGYSKKISIDQFERAFRTATKKELVKAAYLTDKDNLLDALQMLDLNILIDVWGLAEMPEALELIKERNADVYVSLTRAKAMGWIHDVQNYPLRALLDSGISVLIDVDMPTLFGHHLSTEYLLAVNAGLITLDELQTIALQTLQRSHLGEEDKQVLTAAFELEYEILREQHLTT